MKFATPLSSLLLLAGFALADTEPASFDTVYDNSGASMDIVACSNLASRFPTFGSLPTFPNIGGSSAVTGFASPGCGTCWKLTDSDTGVSIIVTAIDVAEDGFNLSEDALNTLTNGQAESIGVAQVNVEQVDASQCGL